MPIFSADSGSKSIGTPPRSERCRDCANGPLELVLLDISLNGERDAGFAIRTEIHRNKPLLPVIFLTSHDAEVDKISGLRLDADDYLMKEVSLDYLVVRIEALFRRRDAYATNQTRHTNTSGAGASSDIEFDAGRSTATWRPQPLDLTLTQFWILQEICRVPGRIKSTAELMRAARLTVAPNTIAAHVKAIREAFLRRAAPEARSRSGSTKPKACPEPPALPRAAALPAQ